MTGWALFVDYVDFVGGGGVAPVNPPTNIALPAISGTATQGETLTASQGDWTGNPTGFAFQWQADGIAISGATGSSYLLTESEVGKTVTVSVTATNAGGSNTVTSAGVGPVELPSPAGVTSASWDAISVWNLQNPNAVGPQPSTQFKIPGVDTPPTGASWNATTRRMNLNAGTILDGWDFTSPIDGGGINVNGANVIIRNCKFWGVTAASGVASFPYTIQVRVGTNSPNCLVEYCEIDGLNREYPTAAGINNGVGSAGMEVRYCRIKGLSADNINCATDAIIHHNHLIVGGFAVGSHADGIQSNGGGLNVYANLIDMTPKGQPDGTINTAIFPSYSLGLGAVIIRNNIVLGYATLPSLPINISNTTGAQVYDNLFEKNSTGAWRYPTTQGRITRSDGNEELSTSNALPEYVANTVMPAISGTAQVGQTLTVANGTWVGSGTISYARQWRKGTSNISGATGTTYTPVSGDVGSTISCRTTATDANGSSYADAPATAAVIA